MSDAPDRDLLAAEYVLGTLEGEEAVAAARLLETDPVFAAAVRAWEERLAPLAAGVPPVPPPPQLWNRIETTMAPSAKLSETTTTTPSAKLSETTMAAPSAKLSEATTAPSANLLETTTPATVVPLALRRRLRIWQASTGAALAIAASLAAFIVLHPAAPRVAVLAPLINGAPVLLATVEANGVLTVRPDGTITVPDDHDLELWALPAGETRPHSLGVLPAAGRRLVATLPSGTQLMVSLEPRGGSPTGEPTGPVMYGGRLTALE
jgi:anti-sigma-K factor RskA